jgi:hypothetical protein
MQRELIAVLRFLAGRGGSSVVRNASELGLTPQAFTVAANFLHQQGLIVQEGLTGFVLWQGPVGLRLTPTGLAEIERIDS